MKKEDFFNLKIGQEIYFNGEAHIISILSNCFMVLTQNWRMNLENRLGPRWIKLKLRMIL